MKINATAKEASEMMLVIFDIAAEKLRENFNEEGYREFLIRTRNGIDKRRSDLEHKILEDMKRDGSA